MLRQKRCEELTGLETVRQAQVHVCEECVKTGATWVHLRTCQTCGRTHCCDSSPNQHAALHFRTTQHPVIASAEPGERWGWCYRHELLANY